MSNMSSFYGGRTATPFTIVKRFDGISLAENTYGKDFYAVIPDESNQGEFVLDIRTSNLENDNVTIIDGAIQIKAKNNTNTYYIIQRTGSNFRNHQWESFSYNEEGITIKNVTYMLPKIETEGMLQCFNKGAETTNKVNYGEYVIIDTVTNFNQYSNPDNGKIFRRGFNADNGMAGAEYIGKIIGPQGFNSGIEVDDYDAIVASNFNYKNSHGLTSEELLPGDKNNTIQCISANYMDEDGNVLTTKIGFKFPYLVNSFTAIHRSPYDERGNIVDWSNGELIESINNDENRPFYKQWKISIPKGIKGDTLEVIRIQPTIIPQGTKIYNTLNDLKNNISNSITTELIDIVPSEYKVSNNIKYIEKDSKFYKVEDCTNFKVFYTYRNYDTLETGIESAPIEVGDINSIIKTTLDSDGTLKIYYDNGKIETAQNKIRWINNLQVNDTGPNRNYKLHVNYNTSKLNGNKEEDIGESISYIKNLRINTDDDQKLYVTYNIKDGTLDKEEAIGAPINYIKRLYVANEKDVEDNRKLKVNCLYAEYSDPYYKSEDEYLTIKSQGENIKWVQINTIFPKAEGVKIINYFTTTDELEKYGAPEVETNDINSYGAVVVLNNNICIYDYVAQKWINTGAQIGNTTDPTAIIKIVEKNMLPNVSTVLPLSIIFEQESIAGR